MKYIIILGDGMSDEPIAQLGNQTPLEAAETRCLDRLSKKAKIGMVHTIPDGMKPGSDTANLSVLGYDPKVYYSGRSPLEALSIGVPMNSEDIAIRCNLVTISEEEDSFQDKIMIDHSSSEISTQDAKVLIDAVANELASDIYAYYVGTSYRHCLIWKQGKVVELVPPHDILGQNIKNSLPQENQLKAMMEKSYAILVNHPINIERKKQGLNPANCCWFWGAGTKPNLTSFQEKTGKTGYMVSAVDLLKGIAVGTGMGVANVEGANGGLHTNYQGKVDASIKALCEDGYDFVYVHIEAPDEMGHQGDIAKKQLAIEYLDAKVIEPIVKMLEERGEGFRMLVLPDHPTPISIRTHTSDDVPYLLYDSTKEENYSWNYNEKEAKISPHLVEVGHTLIDMLFEN